MSCHWRRESDDKNGRPRLGAVVGPVRAEGVRWYRGDDALISLHLSLSLSRMWGGSHDDDGGRPPPSPSPSPSRIRRPRKMTHYSQVNSCTPPRRESSERRRVPPAPPLSYPSRGGGGTTTIPVAAADAEVAFTHPSLGAVWDTNAEAPANVADTRRTTFMLIRGGGVGGGCGKKLWLSSSLWGKRGIGTRTWGGMKEGTD